MATSHGGAGRSAARDRCIVCVPRGASAPEPLLSSLHKRDVDVVVCDDPYRALVESMRADGAAAMSAQPAASLVVICSPTSVDLSGELVQRVRRYSPRTTTWSYDEQHTPALRPATPADTARWPGSPAPVVPAAGSASMYYTGASNGRMATPRSEVPLRLVDALEPDRRGAPHDARPQELLTAEELAMLLGDEPPAPPSSGREASR